MDPAAEILVIILSIFLALFLLLGIILTVYLIRLTGEIKKITQSAKRTVDSFEDAVTNASKFASPMYVAKIIGSTIKKFKDK
ncbi:MAG: exported protein of unknown function [Candidatus Saccharibacteria bacterium]|nr:exported protein of unknown function [Candidatus Saccharibacteria bacterium]